MLTIELIEPNIPQLIKDDTVSKALQLLSDYKLTHLPVVSEDNFLGMIAEDDLMDAEDQKATIEYLLPQLIPALVKQEAHFLAAVTATIEFECNIVAVVGQEQKLKGVITASALLKTLGNFTGADKPGGIIVLGMNRQQYAISEISRICESNDCSILHLNTTFEPENSRLMVTLHLNKTEIGPLVHSFERYEYEVLYYQGKDEVDGSIKSNYDHLMNYLDI
jgi:acetoin utilization protein AcuB